MCPSHGDWVVESVVGSPWVTLMSDNTMTGKAGHFLLVTTPLTSPPRASPQKVIPLQGVELTLSCMARWLPRGCGRSDISWLLRLDEERRQPTGTCSSLLALGAQESEPRGEETGRCLGEIMPRGPRRTVISVPVALSEQSWLNMTLALVPQSWECLPTSVPPQLTSRYPSASGVFPAIPQLPQQRGCSENQLSHLCMEWDLFRSRSLISATNALNSYLRGWRWQRTYVSPSTPVSHVINVLVFKMQTPPRNPILIPHQYRNHPNFFLQVEV